MDTAPARRHLLDARRAFVEGVLDCAAAVETPATGRRAVVGPFREALGRRDLLTTAPTVLAECVAAAGGDLQATPVADPPYVVVTSTGLALRATLDGGRLVVRVDPFAVERDPVQYVRRGDAPEDAVSVALDE